MLRSSGERKMPKCISKLPTFVMIKLDCSLTNLCSLPPTPPPQQKKTWAFFWVGFFDPTNPPPIHYEVQQFLPLRQIIQEIRPNPSSPPAKGLIHLGILIHQQIKHIQLDLSETIETLPSKLSYFSLVKAHLSNLSISSNSHGVYVNHHRPRFHAWLQVSPTKRDEIGWYEFLGGIDATNACWVILEWDKDAVDGWNPAKQLVGSLSHDLQGLYIPGGYLGFLPSTVSWLSIKKKQAREHARKQG